MPDYDQNRDETRRNKRGASGSDLSSHSMPSGAAPLRSGPLRISRSKIDLYLSCQRCFFLDRKHGIKQPPSYPLSLNVAVDALLKSEFDQHRVAQTSHPLISKHGLNLVPFHHEDMDKWRDSLHAGITYHIKKANLLVTGGVDDIWVNPQGTLFVVDYKATAKKGAVSLDELWQIGYKRQVEVYQWLFRKNGFDVSDTAYFVYCNGDKSRPEFGGRLDFSISLIPYNGNADWVEPTLQNIAETLSSDTIPEAATTCKHCTYRRNAARLEHW